MPAQASAPRARIQLSSSQRPLTFEVEAINERGESVSTAIAGEAPLTLYLDKREIVTLMTLGQAPEALALGYLRNQRLLPSMDNIASVQVDWETNAVAITTNASAPESEDHETQTLNAQHLDQRLSKRTVTTGCGQGTVFGDLMAEIDDIRLRDDVMLTEEALYSLLDAVRRHETIYKSAGAVHGCALAAVAGDAARILMFVEDVGRHNAVDAIAGRMWLEVRNGDQGGADAHPLPRLAFRPHPHGTRHRAAHGHHHDRPRREQALPALHRPAPFREDHQSDRLRMSRPRITGVILAGGLCPWHCTR